MTRHKPSDFPYLASISQFWTTYTAVYREIRDRYPPNWGYHGMICVIGASFTVEYLLKGAYENSLGWLTEWWEQSSSHPTINTAEDDYAIKLAKEYEDFVRLRPWYEFDFASKIAPLWDLPSIQGASTIRRWERRLGFGAELAGKAVWAWLIGLGTKAAYETEEANILVWAENFAIPAEDQSKVKPILAITDSTSVYSMPRYEPFTHYLEKYIGGNVHFIEISGNDQILITFVAPREWRGRPESTKVVAEWPILTQDSLKRVAIVIPTNALHVHIPILQQQGLRIDHVFDF